MRTLDQGLSALLQLLQAGPHQPLVLLLGEEPLELRPPDLLLLLVRPLGQVQLQAVSEPRQSPVEIIQAGLGQAARYGSRS